MSPQLPSSPNLQYYKNCAKDVLKAHKRGDASVCALLRRNEKLAKLSDEELLAAKVTLAQVQHAYAKDYGFRNWADMKARLVQAAGEITSLIKESSTRVQEGAQLSDETGASLKEIMEGAQATVAKITEIATATVEQASNATQVGEAIHGISDVTERAAAGSEEMASSSEELGAQASSLRNLVSRFKTSGVV